MGARKRKKPNYPHAAMGERIRAKRHELGLGGEEFATSVGYTESHLYVVERGEVMPRPRKLVRIAAALGVSRYWLVTGEREEPST